MGHRNPQGLVKFEDTIFSLEHGPQGGDELNEIKAPRADRVVTNVMTKHVDYFDAPAYEDLLYRLALKTKSDSEEIEDPAFASAAKHLMQAWKAYSSRSGN